MATSDQHAEPKQRSRHGEISTEDRTQAFAGSSATARSYRSTVHDCSDDPDHDANRKDEYCGSATQSSLGSVALVWAVSHGPLDKPNLMAP